MKYVKTFIKTLFFLPCFLLQVFQIIFYGSQDILLDTDTLDNEKNWALIRLLKW